MSAVALPNDAADPFTALCEMERVCNPSAFASTHPTSQSARSSGSPKQALVFEAGGMLWALPRPWVREVIRQPRLTRIPNAAAEIQGLTNLRGILVPVLDLGALLGLAGFTTVPAMAICLQQGRQLVGLGARRVLGLRPMPVGLQRDVSVPALAHPQAWCGALALEQGLWAGVLDWPHLLQSSGIEEVAST
jgi:chemotaxis signal transduction protein